MSLLGGLMGSEEKTVGKVDPSSRTTVSNSSHGSSTQNKIDPRMEQAIYGAGGIMPNASAWYAQNQSGLNDKMITGMNNQWNQLGASKQGFDQMQNLGMGLMGGGSAGNPFTGGGGIAPQQLSYKPAEMGGGSVSGGGASSPFVMPTPAPAPAMLPSYDTGGGGGGGDSGSGGWGGAAAAMAGAVGAGGGAGTGNGHWMTDESGDKFWQPTGGEYAYGSSSGGYSNPLTKPRGYSFNNGNTAYGADGSNGGGF
jgi:hypothetical protein